MFLAFHAIHWRFVLAACCLFAMTRALGDDGIHDILYDPTTGELKLVFNGKNPSDDVIGIMITGPEPLGFPQAAPLWRDVAYQNGKTQLMWRPLPGKEPLPDDIASWTETNVTKDTVLLLYRTGLSQADFGDVVYFTAGRMCKDPDRPESPIVIDRPRTVTTRVQVINQLTSSAPIKP